MIQIFKQLKNGNYLRELFSNSIRKKKINKTYLNPFNYSSMHFKSWGKITMRKSLRNRYVSN